jgi:hypothetical protein
VTDREAILRLAGVVWDHLTEQLPTKNLVNELARIMDAEPAAPTVTREQAEEVEALLNDSLPKAHFYDELVAALRGDLPAFFRAVADALEGE